MYIFLLALLIPVIVFICASFSNAIEFLSLSGMLGIFLLPFGVMEYFKENK